jgi:hypothetical protein
MRDQKEREKLIFSKKKDQDDFLDKIMKKKESKEMELENFRNLELDADVIEL